MKKLLRIIRKDWFISALVLTLIGSCSLWGYQRYKYENKQILWHSMIPDSTWKHGDTIPPEDTPWIEKYIRDNSGDTVIMDKDNDGTKDTIRFDTKGRLIMRMDTIYTDTPIVVKNGTVISNKVIIDTRKFKLKNLIVKNEGEGMRILDGRFDILTLGNTYLDDSLRFDTTIDVSIKEPVFYVHGDTVFIVGSYKQGSIYNGETDIQFEAINPPDTTILVMPHGKFYILK